MVETITEPLLVLDDGLRVLTANRSFYKTFHISPPTSNAPDMSRQIEAILWNIPRLKAHMDAVIANKYELRDVEIAQDIENLGYKTLRFNACELWQPSLQPRRFLLTIEDITQKKRSEQQAQALLQSAPDAIVVVDENGCIKIINQRTESMFGYQSAELIGQPLEILVPDRYRQQHFQYREKFLQHPRSQAMSIVQDIYAKHKNGSEIPVDVSLSPFESTEGLLVVGAVRDVSEHKYIESELRRHRDHLEDLVAQRTADLQASNKELESYSYSIAHDLRAPLRAITSFSQILQEDAKDKLSADDLEHLNRVIVAGKKMAQLIDDILELSRITRKEIHFSSVNLSKISHDIVARLTQLHPDRNVRCQVQENLIVSGDARLLECALQNLLENAWKFTRGKTPASIEIGAVDKGEETQCYVKDNGIGFDMEYAEKLFRPFHRLHSAEDYDGTGVGLATVRRIIQRHGGRVWAQSELRQGATFYFTIPIKTSLT
ncbi:MAG: PAS domain S-box protein [Gammaproteobacteria bacterium]|nr:PAS domain S-box protein [Gammaproteobacteria bacterium]